MPITMSLLVQNCCGLGNPRTVKKLGDYIQAKDPTVTFLAETQIDDARLDQVLCNFDLEISGQLQVEIEAVVWFCYGRKRLESQQKTRRNIVLMYLLKIMPHRSGDSQVSMVNQLQLNDMRHGQSSELSMINHTSLGCVWGISMKSQDKKKR